MLVPHRVRDAIPVWLQCYREKRRPTAADFEKTEAGSYGPDDFDLDTDFFADGEKEGPGIAAGAADDIVPIADADAADQVPEANASKEESQRVKNETWQQFNSRMQKGTLKFVATVTAARLIVLRVVIGVLAELMYATLDLGLP